MDEKKEIKNRLEEPVIVEETGKLPVKVISEGDKEAMYKAYRKGMAMTEIAEEFGLTYRSVIKYKQKGLWDARKEQDLAILKATPEQLSVEAYTKVLRTVLKLADIIERQVVLDESAEGGPVKVDLKTIVECIDKLTRLHLFAKAGGVDQKKKIIEKRIHKIDYAAMAKIYMQAKQQDNLEYDAKAHLRDVIDASYKESSDDEET